MCIKGLENQGTVAEIWTWMRSCILEGLSMQITVWTGKKNQQIIKKNWCISQTVIMEELNIGLASVNHITAG